MPPSLAEDKLRPFDECPKILLHDWTQKNLQNGLPINLRQRKYLYGKYIGMKNIQ